MAIPEFCPNDLCPRHYGAPKEMRWYRKAGSYSTAAFGEVQRYLCLACGRGFSDQTFELDYYVKRPVSYLQVFERVTGGGGLRGIGRNLSVGHQAVANRIGRLARQAIALHARLMQLLSLDENIATDGFESFVGDKYMPNNIHTLVGSHSQFFYAFDYAHLRRKGRMTDRQKAEQKRREEEEYIREPCGIAASFKRIIDELELLLQGRAEEVECILKSDEKLEYLPPIEGSDVLQELASRGLFLHQRTSSEAPRTKENPLFPVNYLERQIRKDNANHVRKTVQFSRDVNNCMERMAVYQMFHNYFKPYRVEGAGRVLRHGQVAGIPREEIDRELRGIFRLRKFYTHLKLTFSQLLLWARMVGNLDRVSGGYWPQYVWM